MSGTFFPKKSGQKVASCAKRLFSQPTFCEPKLSECHMSSAMCSMIWPLQQAAKNTQSIRSSSAEHLSIGALAARLRHTSSTTPKQTSENESCFMRTVSYRPVTKSFTSIPIHWDRVAKSMPCTGTLRFAECAMLRIPLPIGKVLPFNEACRSTTTPKVMRRDLVNEKTPKS